MRRPARSAAAVACNVSDAPGVAAVLAESDKPYPRTQT